MKYTSLFCAAIAAMGMQAFAVPTEVASDDFEDYDLSSGVDDNDGDGPKVKVATLGNDFNTKGWSVETDDDSALVTSHFGGSQALKLNTNGQTLTLNVRDGAGTTEKYAVTVSMTVEMVASDTIINDMVDELNPDTETHTALFLYKPDETAEFGTLMAFSSDTTKDQKWVALTTDDENFVPLNDKDTAEIVIEIDYNTQMATYTVNGTTFNPIKMANPDTVTSSDVGYRLHSVGFRGTGYVDDLMVSEEQKGKYADFIYELAGQDPETYSKNIEDFTMDDELQTKAGYTPFAALYERANDEDTWLADLQLGQNNVWLIDEDTYTFVEGGTYVIKAGWNANPVTITILDEDDNVVDTITSKKWFESFTWSAPNGGSFEGYMIGEAEFAETEISIASLEADTYTIVLLDYEAGSQPSGPQTVDQIVTSGTLTWTAIDMAAGTVSFSFTPVAGFDSTAEIGDMALTVKPSLTYAQTFAVPCTNITFAAGTGTAMIDTAVLDQADQAFLVGLQDAPAQQGE